MLPARPQATALGCQVAVVGTFEGKGKLAQTLIVCLELEFIAGGQIDGIADKGIGWGIAARYGAKLSPGTVARINNRIEVIATTDTAATATRRIEQVAPVAVASPCAKTAAARTRSRRAAGTGTGTGPGARLSTAAPGATGEITAVVTGQRTGTAAAGNAARTSNRYAPNSWDMVAIC